jgi:ubiquinone/menaquinone biosynthesis C-methylase UbiE
MSMAQRSLDPVSPESSAYFDERANRYDRIYDRPAGYAVRSRMAAVLRVLGAGPGDVLDAGMGAGRLLVELARRDWVVSGVDGATAMVVAARKRLPNAAERLLQGKIDSIPFPDASFDAVVSTGVLEYAEVERALDELRRVLRPGGLAVVSYPNPRNFYWLWRAYVWYPAVRLAKWLLRRPPLVFPPPSRTANPAEFRALLEGARLQPEAVYYTSFLVLPSPFDALLPRTAERLALLLERRRSRLSRRFSGQVVYSARKPANAADAARRG